MKITKFWLYLNLKLYELTDKQNTHSWSFLMELSFNFFSFFPSTQSLFIILDIHFQSLGKSVLNLELLIDVSWFFPIEYGKCSEFHLNFPVLKCAGRDFPLYSWMDFSWWNIEIFFIWLFRLSLMFCASFQPSMQNLDIFYK